MSWSVKMFRVKGIDVKVHLTFLLILAWAAYRWGISDGKGLEGALFGVVVTLLLFVAVTLHELGHSFQALRFGIPVKDITLWPFGGLAQIERIPEDPKQELRIALGGPVVNVVIAAVLIGLSSILRVQGWMSVDRLYQALGDVSWEGLLAYLVTANLTLAIFNLLPAFPMDGGRVLRAFLAMRIDHRRATRLAVGIGQALAWAIGLWGFVSGSYTLIFIAIFVYLAAGQEGRTVEVKGILGETRVGQAMSREVTVLNASDPLSRAAELTLGTMQADFPVVEDGRLVGLLTSQDLLSGLRQGGADQTVGQAMHRKPMTVSPQDLLFEVQQQMSRARLSAVPVVEGDRVVGLLTTADVNEIYRLLSVEPTLAATG